MSAELNQPGRELRCTKCGYDLRGHDRESLCPECATPVVISIDGLRLPADPRWLQKIRCGLVLVLIGGTFRLLPDPVLRILPQWDVVWWALMLVWWSTVLGVILATSPELEPGVQPERVRYVRVGTRVLALLLPCVFLVLTAVDRGMIGPTNWRSIWTAYQYMGIALFVFGMWHLSYLVRRLGSRRLVKHCWCILLVALGAPAIPITWLVLSGGFGMWPLSSGRSLNPADYVIIFGPQLLVMGWFASLLYCAILLSQVYGTEIGPAEIRPLS